MVEYGDNIAILACGCFWSPEEKYQKIEGVIKTKVGYIGGSTDNPDYKSVCYNDTGHAEAVYIEFDPSIISYEKLLEIFFKLHNPTTPNRQGLDIGNQYRSEIFYTTESQREIAEKIKNESAKMFPLPIVTQITKATEFFDAEEYHQKYIQKNRR